MATTLVMLCAAATRLARTSGFAPPAEPLDDAGRRAAARCVLEPRFRAEVRVGPSLAARQTAEAMGLPGREEAALADIDHGAWRGQEFAQVHAAAPDDFAAWLADPTRGAPEGETMASVQRRVGDWLDEIAGIGGPVCAITHPTVVRGALAHALAIPARSVLAIDFAPLSRTVLSFNRVWRLQGIVPFD